MITSNSTFDEIETQKALDESNIRDFLANKLHRDGTKLRRILKVKAYYTPSHPATYHSHTTGIHWRILQILMHDRKPTPLQRAQGYNFIVESENQIKYTIIDDLETGRPILVLPYPNQAFFVSAHAIRRYRERALGNQDTDFTGTCDTLIRRSPYFVLRMSRRIYGATDFHSLVFRVADGLFLGYYDDKRNIGHLETFLPVDMLTEHEKEFSGHKYDDKMLKDQRDMVLGLIPFDQTLSDTMTTSNIYREKDGELREMSPEEIDMLIKIAREEHDAIPAEVHQQHKAEEQQQNRERYKRKMMRKGYK